MEPVGYAVHDAVAVATIDRPQTRNALSADVLRALAAAMDRAEADPEGLTPSGS